MHISDCILKIALTFNSMKQFLAQIFLLLLFHTFSRQPFLYIFIFIVSNLVLTLMIVNLEEDSNLEIAIFALVFFALPT